MQGSAEEAPGKRFGTGGGSIQWVVGFDLRGSVRGYLEWSAPQDSRWPPIAPSSGPQLNMRGQDKHTLPLHPKAGAFTA